ncbi:MAG: hypothetical protein JW927_03130 [Deltaproteobacteria bacterium]|nr:hypothetical protein [Deltaproteobacteria bacterium]
MPDYLITMRGNLFRPWPPGEEIKLLSCKFTPGDKSCDFEVQVEISAKDDNEAMNIGRDMCSDAVDLLEFCLDEQTFLNSREIYLKPLESSEGTGICDFGLHLCAVDNKPPSEEQMAAIRKVINIYNENKGFENQEILARIIHWQASGRRESQSDIDRFLKFWIALEVLVGGAGKVVVKKIKKHLASLYDNINTQNVGELIGRIYGVRCAIFHFGIRHPNELKKRLKELEDIFNDLLRSKLGLEFKAFAKRHILNREANKSASGAGDNVKDHAAPEQPGSYLHKP